MSSSANANSRNPNGDIYVKLAAAVLQERCSNNNDLDDMQLVTRFHSSRIPGITIPDYFKRIAKYSFSTPECHVIALIYIDRFCAAKQLPLTFRSIHRLVIVCVMIAAKLRDDVYYSNEYYASVGGVMNRELNELEVDLLLAIGWRTHVSREEFKRYLDALLRRFSHLLDTQQQQHMMLQQQQHQNNIVRMPSVPSAPMENDSAPPTVVASTGSTPPGEMKDNDQKLENDNVSSKSSSVDDNN